MPRLYVMNMVGGGPRPGSGGAKHCKPNSLSESNDESDLRSESNLDI